MSGCRSHLKRLEEEKARLSRSPFAPVAAAGVAKSQEDAGVPGSVESSPSVAPRDCGRRDGAAPSSSRVGIRNLLCDEEEQEDEDEGDAGPEEGRDTPPMREASRAPSGASGPEGPPSGGNASGCLSAAITESLLREHFHLPLQVVAKKFGMCTTAFKKLCRRFGVAKWPHRQLRGIDKKIAALRAELAYSTGDRDVCRRSLQVLEDEKARLSRVTAAAPAPRGVVSPRAAPAWDRPAASPSPFPQPLSESPRGVSSLAGALAVKTDPDLRREGPAPLGDGAAAGSGGGGGSSALDLLAAAAAGAAVPERRVAACLSPGGGWSGGGAGCMGFGGDGNGGPGPFESRSVLRDVEPGGGAPRASS